MIIVDVPSYLEKFSAYLQKVPARVQSNYMLWRVAAASMKYLTEEARKISLQFSKKLTGKTEETPRLEKRFTMIEIPTSNFFHT